MYKAESKTKQIILLAEDDEVNQEIIRAFLNDIGDFELVVANDGRAALEVALLNKFDLLIVDQNMPFITGDRLIRCLRTGQSENATTPVIRFTADADRRPLEVKTINSAPEATLSKPLSKNALALAITALLPHAHLERIKPPVRALP